MEVLVDGIRKLIVPEGTKTYRDLLTFVHTAIGAPRRVILNLTLDGRAIPPGGSEELRDQVIPAEGRLEVVTAEPFRLAVDTLDGLIAHLSTLERGHQRAAEQVIAANYRNAMESFRDCFQGWALVMNALESVSRLLGTEWRSLETPTGSAEPKIRRIQESLTRFKTAFDQQDVVRLGDVTQYDLMPLLEECRSILVELKRRVVSRATTAP